MQDELVDDQKYEGSGCLFDLSRYTFRWTYWLRTYTHDQILTLMSPLELG
jgi:hypothetical protein